MLSILQLKDKVIVMELYRTCWHIFNEGMSAIQSCYFEQIGPNPLTNTKTYYCFSDLIEKKIVSYGW